MFTNSNFNPKKVEIVVAPEATHIALLQNSLLDEEDDESIEWPNEVN